MRPAAVEAACAVVPAIEGWLGANNRELQSIPLLEFRESLQRLGFLRKYKGSLLPSRRARAALHADAVHELVVEALLPATGSFDHAAGVLLLAYIATTEPGAKVPIDAVAAAATELGWRVDHGPVPAEAIRDMPLWVLLTNIGRRPGDWRDRFGTFSPEATTIAREALLR
ncbi:hypothetical protein [Brachybacterium phenoliresistens]|uniref:hypothetical protein n=1 Tax=Brachybacterium phenoliresistens TaxID=396014 RepID=UPI0004ACB27F|nr:hypothetical protein [Brachybacterium phenoliresistens]